MYIVGGVKETIFHLILPTIFANFTLQVSGKTSQGQLQILSDLNTEILGKHVVFTAKVKRF